jgi:glutamine synthetase
VVLGTLHDPTRSNELSPLCARGLLARVLDTARKDHGIVFQVGAEIEFILVHDEGELPEKQLPKPVDSSVFANATTLTDQEEFIADLCLQLEKQDIGVELIHAESAAGQLELVLPYETDVMRLADNVVLTRDTIRSVARAHNMRALFLPKVDPMQAGNGLHVHLSFRDLSSLTPNENAFPHREEVGRMSEKGESCLEGILNHLPGLMALTLPTSNSYRRVGKGCWTGNTISWATEDKESPLRVCLDLETGVATNLEMKLSDSTANIYLELAALLSAALDGMVRNLKLRPSISEDDPGLPANLGESLERLLQDSFLCAVLGKQLTTSYVTVRQAELEFAAQIEECEEVIIAYKKA